MGRPPRAPSDMSADPLARAKKRLKAAAAARQRGFAAQERADKAASVGDTSRAHSAAAKTRHDDRERPS